MDIVRDIVPAIIAYAAILVLGARQRDTLVVVLALAAIVLTVARLVS